MRTILSTVALFFALHFFAFAQPESFTSVNVGKLFPAEKPSNIKGIFHLGDGKIVSVRDMGEFLEIIHYNNDLQIEYKSQPIKFTYKQEEAKNYFKYTYLLKDDKIMIIFLQKYDKPDKWIVWANILYPNKETLKYAEPVKIAEIYPKDQIEEYAITLSEDKSKVLFTYYLNVKDPDKRDIVAHKVFTDDLTLLYECKLEDINIISAPGGIYKLANNGKIVDVIPIKDESVSRRDKTQQDVFLMIYIFDTAGSIENTFTLKMNENIFFKDFDIQIDKNNILRAAAVYSKDYESIFSSGLFNFSIDLEHIKEPVYTRKEFPENVVTEFNTPSKRNNLLKQKDKGEEIGIDYLTVSEIISNQDGYYTVMRSSWDYYNQGRLVYHFMSDYIIASFSNDDQLLWIKKIPMSLRATVRNYYTDNFIIKNDNLYILFFDSDENINNPEDVKNGKRDYVANYLVVYKISKNGTVENRSVIDIKELGYSVSWIPYHHLVKNQDDEVILFFYDKDDASFLKVKLIN